MGISDPLPKPNEIKLSDIPDMLLAGNSVNWIAVQAALGLTDDEKLKDALLLLYRTNWVVNYYVNQVLLVLAVPALSGQYELPPPPPEGELMWMVADLYCESCPGSEYTQYANGFAAPLCGNDGRVARYTECAKYRETMTDAVISPEQVTAHYQRLKDDFKELLNERPPSQVADGSGLVDQNLSPDRNLAADVIARHFG